jgi:hypothetical protein
VLVTKIPLSLLNDWSKSIDSKFMLQLVVFSKARATVKVGVKLLRKEDSHLNATKVDLSKRERIDGLSVL